jgi:hypothetical protein|tara:strand:- start:36040 stop:36888 length:849 start_codon:yes stop_codon:yes gene_type:complete
MSRDITNEYGKRIKKLDTIYIGYDPRENKAVNVLIDSIERHASRPINIVTINELALRRVGLYRRAPDISSTCWADGEPGDMIDAFDKRPFSTAFSFSRFLTPFLNQLEGLALFMDSDMYFRSDPCELFDSFATEGGPAVWCVKHGYDNGGSTIGGDKFGYGEGRKMYGCPQTSYSRKNWSSFVLWNCGHPANKRLTVDDANTKPGGWLHKFSWLDDSEIGALPEKWNWLDGHSDERIEPANVHFTTGGPWFANTGWKPLRDIDEKYAKEWIELSKAIPDERS